MAVSQLSKTRKSTKSWVALAVAAIACLLAAMPETAVAQNAIPEPCRFALTTSADEDSCAAYFDRMDRERQHEIARTILKEGPDRYPPGLLRRLAAQLPTPQKQALEALALLESARQGGDLDAKVVSSASEESRANRNPTAMAYLWYARATLAATDSDWQSVGPALRRARNLADRQGLIGLLSEIDFSAGEHALRERRFADGEERLSTAYLTQIRAGRRDRAGRSCQLLAGAYAYNMDNDIALLQQRTRDEGAEAHPCYMAALFYRGQRTEAPYDEMEKLSQEAVTAIRKRGLATMVPSVLNSTAMAASRAGEYGEAVRYYDRAERGFRAVGDEFMEAATAANQAHNLSEIGATDRAIEVLERSLATFRRAAPDRLDSILKVQRQIALAHERDGRLDEASDWFDRAMTTSEDFPIKYFEGLVGSDYARVLYAKGERDRAMDMAETSVERLLNDGVVPDSAAASRTLTWMASRHLDEQRVDVAARLLGQATELMDPDGKGASSLLEHPGDLFVRLEYATNMANLLSEIGRSAEANEYARVALQLSETRLQDEKIRALANADLQMAMSQQETRLADMEQNARIDRLTLRNNRLTIFASLAAALIAALIALTVYRFYRQQKLVADVKDTFLNEIHHRTSNNLQLIVSLLRMDRNGGDDRIGDAANRARTMGLIHNHVFMDGRDEPISAQVFLKDLAKLLDEALGNDRVALEVRSDDVDLPVPMLTPIGLLVCEAVTNAYKYAFPDDREGTVSVTLDQASDGLQLRIADDGIGTENIVPSDGSYLLEDLVAQLGGSLSRHSSPSDGTEVLVRGMSAAPIGRMNK